MQDPTQVSPNQFIQSMQQDVENYLANVMNAVNKAPDGEWIEASEEEVRDLAAEFRTLVFQNAIQARIDAAEAAFSPSARNNHRPGHREDGHQTAPE